MLFRSNMGVGMCVVVDKADADRACGILCGQGERAYVIGEIRSGERGVEMK